MCTEVGDNLTPFINQPFLCCFRKAKRRRWWLYDTLRDHVVLLLLTLMLPATTLCRSEDEKEKKNNKNEWDSRSMGCREWRERERRIEEWEERIQLRSIEQGLFPDPITPVAAKSLITEWCYSHFIPLSALPPSFILLKYNAWVHCLLVIEAFSQCLSYNSSLSILFLFLTVLSIKRRK